MKRFLAALALCCASVVAQDDPFLTGDALLEDIKRCADGCIVMTREEAAALMQQVQAVVDQRTQQAYQAGRLACRNAT